MVQKIETFLTCTEFNHLVLYKILLSLPLSWFYNHGGVCKNDHHL